MRRGGPILTGSSRRWAQQLLATAGGDHKIAIDMAEALAQSADTDKARRMWAGARIHLQRQETIR